MPPGPPVTGDTAAFYSAYAKVTCPTGSEIRGGYCYTPNTIFPPENNSVPDTCAGTNPCNAGTGNKYQRELDFESVGAYPLQLERAYNSNVIGKGRFSEYWTGFYDRSIIANNDGTTSTAIIRRNGGKAHYFKLINGAWVGDAQVVGTLIRQTDAALTLTGWIFVNEYDETEVYDVDGKLLAITNHQGQSHFLTYSCKTISANCTVVTPPTIARIAGLLITVMDSVGRKLNFTYDGSSRVNTMTDPSGGGYLYTYSGAAPDGNLISVTYPDGKKKTYLYGETANVSATPNIGVSYTHALTGIIDENGARYASWIYDAAGRATSSEHGAFGSGIDHVGLTYTAPDVNGNSTTSVIDVMGVTRTYNFSTLQGVVKSTGIIGQPCNDCSAAVTYDANGNVASRTDFNGNLSCYAYDLSRNLETTRLEGLAPGSSCPANPATYTHNANSIERKISTQWHANYRLPIQIDQLGQRLNFSYDASGNLLQKTVTDTVTNAARTWTYTYNSIGQILTEDGPRIDVNDITTYSYYSDSTATHKPDDLNTVTNALGHVTTYTAYDANGRVLSITDPNSLPISLAYDPRGRLTQKTVDGNITTYSYDAAGNLLKVTQPTGVNISYSYDAAHRLTDIKDDAGNSIHYTLDGMGNHINEDIVDPYGQLITALSRTIDALNRVQKIIGGQ
ncbi:MAG: DUF6531 domain-containing protein [Methylobacter sp.]|nr:DUF6531 domain-containing protein [Methylobacter sp.]